ncbi:PRD domain-containing protein [Anaerococcus rubeinfantis]|uniref:PRD domain-containing protein n=1 Tax=Anaerococcus rubeinfantis TaxID=1720199 RepID=UPI00073F29AC|nr:PRD domain-containing protein [Anaerococcus rubeinfantis]
MKIYKIINNNIISAKDENELEVILMGKGLGFNKKKGDLVEKEKIEKTYHLDNKTHLERLINLLSSIPIEHIDLCLDIVSHIQDKFDYKLNENIYISLTDHISFAIKRREKGYNFTNPLLHEVRNIYKQEFELGLYAVNYLNKNLNINFDEHEASSIALHIVDAEYDRNPSEIVSQIEDIREIIKIIYEGQMSENLYGKDYILYDYINKFITRIKEGKQKNINDKKLYYFIRSNYKKDFMTTLSIVSFVENKYKTIVTDEEKTMLTLLINRKRNTNQ